MTQQHLQQNINANPTFSRNANQVDIDDNLTTPAVVLTNDDAFVVFGDDGSGAYRANLPDVRTNPGHDVALAAGAAIVTIATVEIDGVPSGQTINGAATFTLSANTTVMLRADPPGLDGSPPTNWFTTCQR